MTTLISKAQAELELALMQAESDSMASSDLYIWLRVRSVARNRRTAQRAG
ncbi:hypothetical protein [Pseudomonas sp. v388]|nr:hypothetical protein [Pseudomonas sp. v388]